MMTDDKSKQSVDPVEITANSDRDLSNSTTIIDHNNEDHQNNGIKRNKADGKYIERYNPKSNEMDERSGSDKNKGLFMLNGDSNRTDASIDKIIEEESKFLDNENKMNLMHNKAEINGGMREVLFYGDSLTWGMSHNYTGRYKITWPQLIEKNIRQYGFGLIENALCSRTTLFDDEGDNQWMTGGEPHYFNGMRHFSSIYGSHSVRVLVILLGTNDLKERIRTQAKFRVDANLIAKNCIKIAHRAQEIHQIQALHRRFFRDLRNRRRGAATAVSSTATTNDNDNNNNNNKAGSTDGSNANNDDDYDDDKLDIIVVAPPVVVLNQISQKMGYDETSVRISIEFPDAYKSICNKYGYHVVTPEIDMSTSMDGVHITEESGQVIADAVWKVLEKLLIKSNMKQNKIKERQQQTAMMTSDNDDNGNGDHIAKQFIPPVPPEASLFKIPPHAFESIFDSHGYEITIPSVPLHQLNKSLADINKDERITYWRNLIQRLINERHLTHHQVAQEAGIRSVSVLQQFFDDNNNIGNDQEERDELIADTLGKLIKWCKWVISHALVVGAVSGKCALPSTTKTTENNEDPLTIPEGKPPISKYLELDESIYLGDGVPERLPPPKVEPEVYQQEEVYESAPPVKSESQGPGRYYRRAPIGAPYPEAEAMRGEIKKFISQNYAHIKNIADECKVHSFSLKRWLNAESVHQPSVYMAGKAVYNWYIRIKGGSSNNARFRKGENDENSEGDDSESTNDESQSINKGNKFPGRKPDINQGKRSGSTIGRSNVSGNRGSTVPDTLEDSKPAAPKTHTPPTNDNSSNTKNESVQGKDYPDPIEDVSVSTNKMKDSSKLTTKVNIYCTNI